MRVGCITDTIDTLHDGIHGCIITDSRIGAIQIVINRTRQTDYREIELHTEVTGTSQRTVTTDNYQRIDFLLHTCLVSLLHSLGSWELLRTGCFQDSTTTGNNATYILGGKLLNLIMNQSLVTTIYTFNPKTVVNTGTCHSTNSGIHSWCIASRRQDTNCLNLCHITTIIV